LLVPSPDLTSGRRSDLIVRFGPWTPDPAARSAGRILASFVPLLAFDRAIAGSRNRRGEHVERNALFILLLLFGPVLARLEARTFAPGLATITALTTIATITAAIAAVAVILVALAAILGLALVAVVLILGGNLLVLILILIFVGGEVAALPALLLEARPALVENAEIMVGELQIEFGLHPVAGQLRITRQRLIFLVELRRIAALAIVLAIAVITGVGRALPAAAAATPAAVLTIVDQTLNPRLVVVISHSIGRALPSRTFAKLPRQGCHTSGPATSSQDRQKTPEQSGVATGNLKQSMFCLAPSLAPYVATKCDKSKRKR